MEKRLGGRQECLGTVGPYIRLTASAKVPAACPSPCTPVPKFPQGTALHPISEAPPPHCDAGHKPLSSLYPRQDRLPERARWQGPAAGECKSRSTAHTEPGLGAGRYGTVRDEKGRWPQCSPRPGLDPHHLTPYLPLYILKAAGLAGKKPSPQQIPPKQAPGC